MKKKVIKKCAKCGSCPEDDPNISFHRFPRPNKVNKARCDAWAKFCFPTKAWSSQKFQSKLFSDHKMLCDKHFKSSSFSNSSKSLVKGSIPEKKYIRNKPQRVKQANIETVDFTEPESPVQIKIEPADDDGIVIHVHSVEPRNQLKRKRDPLDIDNESFQIQKHKNQHKYDDDILYLDDTMPKNISLKRNIDDDSFSREQLKKGQTNPSEAFWQRNDDDVFYNSRQSKTATQQQIIYEDNFYYKKPTKNYLLDDLNDDCELYGKLLTQKLRTYSLHERNLMMFKIDGLLIEYPPGFKTPLLSTTSFRKKALKSLFKNPTKNEKKKLDKEISLDPLFQARLPDESSSPVPTTSMPSQSPSKNIVEKQTIIGSSSKSIPQVKMIRCLPKEPVQSTISITNQSLKGLCSIPYQPAKVIKSITNHPVNVMACLLNKDQGRLTSDTIKAKSSISNYPVKVTSSIQNHQTKSNSIPNQPAKVMKNTENEPEQVINKTPNEAVKITSNILNPSFTNTPVKGKSIPNHPVKLDNNVHYQPSKVAISQSEKVSTQIPTSVFSPLHISISKTKVVPVTVGKYVPATAHSRGQIRIIKSKPATASSLHQPVLMTVPTLCKVSDNTQSVVHPLDQLSSIAADHASHHYNINYGLEEHDTSEDINVVSHEVVLTSQETMPASQNIVETAFKNANIDGYEC